MAFWCDVHKFVVSLLLEVLLQAMLNMAHSEAIMRKLLGILGWKVHRITVLINCGLHLDVELEHQSYLLVCFVVRVREPGPCIRKCMHKTFGFSSLRPELVRPFFRVNMLILVRYRKGCFTLCLFWKSLMCDHKLFKLVSGSCGITSLTKSHTTAPNCTKSLPKYLQCM